MKQAKWDTFTEEAQALFEKHGIDAYWEFDERDGDGQVIIYTGVHDEKSRAYNEAQGDTGLTYLEGTY
tara:strand:- start:561 stop:764 length:204 start_codon:yes stop_codon:yes gene_type:complete